MRFLSKSGLADRSLQEQHCLSRRLFLAMIGVAGLPLVMPCAFNQAAAMNVPGPAVPPIDAAAPDVTKTATFAMG